MLSDRWLKDYVKIAEDYQILYAKFHVFKEHPAKDRNKVCSQYYVFTCARKVYLYQAYPI